MSVLRPFPSRPSLEFDHKAAKALLRELRAGNEEALARARLFHSGFDLSEPQRAILADAQLIVAREYGFSSWPRLVQYHGDIVRQTPESSINVSKADYYENRVQVLVTPKGKRSEMSARQLAAYVPQFYGVTPEEIADRPVSVDEARLTVARASGFASWDLLMEKAIDSSVPRNTDWVRTPMQQAAKAMREGDLTALKRVVADHPRLMNPDDSAASSGESLMSMAIDFSRTSPDSVTRIIDWLVSQGWDFKQELSKRLCGRGLHTKARDVQYLLEQGADPNWVAANGIPVLEHALVRYWNAEAVDVLAARATPRKALWISAGLGDVDGVRKHLDANGKPIRTATDIRSPFSAIGPLRMPPLVEPDDEELLHEALMIAMLNGRGNVIEYLASRGVNIDSYRWGTPLVNMAVANGWLVAAEAFIRAGANLDLPSRGDSNGSARDMARGMFENGSHGPEFRRIVELCGLNPDEILAARDAKPPVEPAIDPRLQKSIAYAAEHALSQNRPSVTGEDLFFGMLRFGELALLYFTQIGEVNRDAFNADLMARVKAIPEPTVPRPLPVMADAQAYVDDAFAMGVETRREWISPLMLLYAMTRDGKGFAVDLLHRYNGNLEKLNSQLRKEIYRSRAQE